jgi:AraC-like DNA-binding protein
VRYLYDLLSETGITFSERVQDLRLDAALDLLVAPNLSYLRIGEIAFAVGYSDLSYFNRSFRRKFDITPTGARSR